MIIQRSLVEYIDKLGKYYPIISLTGPRQAGKTTLLRELYPDYAYVNFESPEQRAAFEFDPKGFLARYDQRVIFDEAQRVPELFSYLQVTVDENRVPGRFILSGSQNFLLLNKINQSLAGRVGIARLLPLDMKEKRTAEELNDSFFEEIFNGSYPGKIVSEEPADIFYSNYLASYVQRDVKDFVSPANLTGFIRFLEICAGYAGQLINYAQMALAVGVSVPTIKSWIGILEQSYLVFRLPPFYRNIKKRLTKTPKLYFYDTGLACYLLKMRSSAELENYYQFGGLFENMLIADAYKQSWHGGRDPWYSFYRDKSGQEVDLVYDTPAKTIFWEVKATHTFNPALLKTLKKVRDQFTDSIEKKLIYGAEEAMTVNDTEIIPWNKVNWPD